MPIPLQLNSEQRLNLELLCGQQRGDVRTVSCFLRIMQGVRLNEAEKKAVNFRVEGNAYRFDLSRENETTALCTLETLDATELKKMLAGYDQFAPSDLRWLNPVLAQLQEAGA